jgi:hypothetical protein
MEPVRAPPSALSLEQATFGEFTQEIAAHNLRRKSFGAQQPFSAFPHWPHINNRVVIQTKRR